eukprot:TRINITY_DN18790_c0_g1_i1.p1 TRINITY_DN18790_c0_g1~~TRINITY_DN18790_c0_g1_i1.p1  ORF type:complete len:470 (+),score=52.62 TRINITY_DN18790_c0_g1_i1:69-1412(+)
MRAGRIGGEGNRANAAGRGAVVRDGKGAGYGAVKGSVTGRAGAKGKGREHAKGKEQRTRDGAVAGGGAQSGGAAAVLAAICAYDPSSGTIIDAPGLTTDHPIVDCCIGLNHASLLTARGEVLCWGNNNSGQLGVGDRRPRVGLRAARLPWPAHAVSSGNCFSVALRRGGGAICSWGWRDQGRLGRGGDTAVPAAVVGLPRGDPVSLLAAGGAAVIAVTQSGEAYGWGGIEAMCGGGVRDSQCAVRLPLLCGRGFKRLACGCDFGLAETHEGTLMAFGHVPGQPYTAPRSLRPSAGRVAFPLRSLAAGHYAAAAADAAGRLWCLWPQQDLAGAVLPPSERVVRAAVAGLATDRFAVALTAEGRLWECQPGATCRSIVHAARVLQGTVLLPCRGSCADRIVFTPDPSCGLSRCRLLFLIAGRCGLLPGGQMRRAALATFLMDECWIFEE